MRQGRGGQRNKKCNCIHICNRRFKCFYLIECLFSKAKANDIWVCVLFEIVLRNAVWFCDYDFELIWILTFCLVNVHGADFSSYN